MTSKNIMMAAMTLLAAVISAQAQTPTEPKARNYFVTTSNVRPAAENADATGTATDQAPEEEEQLDFISRNFAFVSMCDWTPGMRFMVKPSQKDLVIKTFAEAKTGNMVSTRSLQDKILVYDNHSNTQGALHEHVNFHIEGQPDEVYYFEVPTASFDDYCFGKVGVPALAYLGDVDMAQDSLVGKQVRVLVRDFCQDTDVKGAGFKLVDIGNERRGQVMTITKVGVGTRNFPVKIIVKENGPEGQEFFQYVTISRTNCGYREDELEVSDLKPHTFEGSFQLLDDRLSVGPELQQWVGKKVFTFYNTQMRNSQEKTVTVMRLSQFTITDIYRMAGANTVMLTLVGKNSGETYTKEVAIDNTSVLGSDEVLDRLFVEGNPEEVPGVRPENLPFIQKQQVKKGFTEEEVRLALGEPTDITRVTADVYQWTYMFKENDARPFRVVKFSYRTHKVTQDMTR